MTTAAPDARDDQALLLSSDSENGSQRPTPLPGLQISVLVLSTLIDPMAAQSIYPFINQVRITCYGQVRKS
jgi:hypothetical protein